MYCPDNLLSSKATFIKLEELINYPAYTVFVENSTKARLALQKDNGKILKLLFTKAKQNIQLKHNM